MRRFLLGVRNVSTCHQDRRHQDRRCELSLLLAPLVFALLVTTSTLR